MPNMELQPTRAHPCLQPMLESVDAGRLPNCGHLLLLDLLAQFQLQLGMPSTGGRRIR